jgi:hypothetical protein
MSTIEIKLSNAEESNNPTGGNQEFDTVVRFSVIRRSDQHFGQGTTSTAAAALPRLNRLAPPEQTEKTMFGIALLGAAAFITLVLILLYA